MFEKFAAAVTGFLAGNEKLESSVSDAPVPNFKYPGDYCCILYDKNDWKTDYYFTMCTSEN